jgi:hypothetical protein
LGVLRFVNDSSHDEDKDREIRGRDDGILISPKKYAVRA